VRESSRFRKKGRRKIMCFMREIRNSINDPYACFGFILLLIYRIAARRKKAKWII